MDTEDRQALHAVGHERVIALDGHGPGGAVGVGPRGEPHRVEVEGGRLEEWLRVRGREQAVAVRVEAAIVQPARQLDPCPHQVRVCGQGLLEQPGVRVAAVDLDAGTASALVDEGTDPAALAGDLLTVDDPVLVDELARIPLLYQPGTRFHYSVSTDVLVRVRLADGTEHSAVLRASQPDFTIPAQPSKGEVALSYWQMGTIHILEGLS